MQPASLSTTPASTFIARLHSQRSASYVQPDDSIPENTYEIADVRRAVSLRIPGTYGSSRILDSGRDVAGLSSFTAAGSTLDSPERSATLPYTPPPASRHPLFSHHAQPPSSTYAEAFPFFMSDPGSLDPPSPTGSMSSGAFSPASLFLSHFSSSSSLLPPNPVVRPDAPGARVSDYTLGRTVGRGGFSTVRLATHITSGQTFACKIVKRDDLSDRSGSLEKFEEEIRIWLSLPRHPSLLPLINMHRTPFATFLITPYLPNGSLLDALMRESGSDKTARRWFSGVVAAVAAMHEGFEGFEGGLLHGDLKLENFLVDQAGQVVVCDFYMARRINQVVHTIPPPMTNHGTLPIHLHRGPRKSSPFPSRHSHDPTTMPVQAFPSASLPYAPPELLGASPPGPCLAQDMWALGIILHALLTGKLPFVDAFDPRLQMKILRGTWEEPLDIGKEWIECLRGCLDVNKDIRWDIKRVRESDAVVGWKEVKARSKSRSQSRCRQRPSNTTLFDWTPRGETSAVHAQPLPIAPIRRYSPEVPLLQSQSFPADPSAGGCIAAHRAPSATDSGSRSSGRGGHRIEDFSTDVRGLDQSTTTLEGFAVTRGRSTAKKSHMKELGSQPQPYHASLQPLSLRSSSSSQSPAITSPFRGSHSLSSPSSSRSSRKSASPSVTKSRSRSRALPAWEEGKRYEYGYSRELEAVDEAGRKRGG